MSVCRSTNVQTLLILRTQSVEECLVGLRRFVEHSDVDGGCQKVVCGDDGVDVASQVEIELLHGNDLRFVSSLLIFFEIKMR